MGSWVPRAASLPVPTVSHWRTKPPVAPAARLHNFRVDRVVARAARTSVAEPKQGLADAQSPQVETEPNFHPLSG